jgi:hypothetical protein
LWKHWHEHVKGVAEAKAQTVDRGTVTVLYIVQPDAQGRWGIDVELDRPMDQPCIAFHADTLVRLPAFLNPRMTSIRREAFGRPTRFPRDGSQIPK